MMTQQLPAGFVRPLEGQPLAQNRVYANPQEAQTDISARYSNLSQPLNEVWQPPASAIDPSTDPSLGANRIIQNAVQGFNQNAEEQRKNWVQPSATSTAPTSTEATAQVQNTEGSQPPGQVYKNLSTAVKDIGAVTTQYGGGTAYEKFHPGIDIANKIGTPIPAFAEGTVTKVVTGKKQAKFKDPNDPNKGYGNYVIITDAQGNQHRYSHLENAYVKVGDKVAKGQEVGPMGNSGSTYSNSGGTGAHLDYRIMNAANKYINPQQFINS